MSLTRKMLKAMGIEEEKIDQIIEAHSETVDAIKKERDEFKEAAAGNGDLQKELDKYKKLAEDSKNDSFKVKYEDVKDELEALKNDIKNKETTAAKTEAYKALLKEAGVSEKRIDSVLKVTDLKSIELDGEGKIKGADDLSATIKNEWSDFIVTTDTTGAKAATPPANNGGKLTKEQIFAKDNRGRYVMSAAERQQAIRENAEIFN